MAKSSKIAQLEKEILKAQQEARYAELETKYNAWMELSGKENRTEEENAALPQMWTEEEDSEFTALEAQLFPQKTAGNKTRKPQTNPRINWAGNGEKEIGQFVTEYKTAFLEAFKAKKPFVMPKSPNGLTVTDIPPVGLTVKAYQTKTQEVGDYLVITVIRHQFQMGNYSQLPVREVKTNLLTGEVTTIELLEEEVK